MKNFHYNVPTEIFFGKGAIANLSHIGRYGKRVLLVYGKDSIKKMGLYDKVVRILEQLDMDFFELSGVDPNPRIESVRQGSVLCKKHGVDVVLAVGGGSVIDCAKVIAAATVYEGDAWELVLDSSKIVDALPVVAILTLAATGSEMNGSAVITNVETREKIGTYSTLLKPKFSIMDPEHTFTVSRAMTAAGVADIMSHTFENYFTPVKGAYVQARICESLLKTCIHYGPIALDEPTNYEARANLMWAGTLAINGICSLGQQTGWSVHPLQHQLGAYYDITHGVGLAILTPPWMRYVLSDETVGKFVEYGVNVWGLDANGDPFDIANRAIDQTEAFFLSLGLPMTLSEVGIDSRYLEEMAKNCERRTLQGFVPLTYRDSMAIYKAVL
ncbi:MAG: iron-containing alcohol dehydrogenase [Clostridiaceae bacterium]|jgi:alcohol dehydrogenase YqhD (iron-dependent ADH family)|nr:iron-containing alcohol dehydrogenase [Clostridiaceae bacterium]